jgi:isoquinoline 1-oxidoreductase subunit beta
MKDISRRQFLKGLTIAVSITPLGYKLLNAAEQAEAGPGLKPSVWYEITPDNLITVTIPGSEMGQGIRTALPMMIADDLDADWKQIRVLQAPAHDSFKNPLLGGQITVASAATRGYYEPLRKAGAAGKLMLIKAAAQTWKVSESDCIATKGTVKNKKSNRSLTYGQLCKKAAELEVPKDPPLKKEEEFKFMGKSMPRMDIPEKVSGKAVYGLDVEVPGMLYGVVARQPAYGAKPVSFDQKAAEAVKGVQKVFPSPNGITVCADSLDAAWKGRDALKVQWSPGSHPELNDESIEKSFLEDLNKQGAVATNVGDVKKALEEASKKLDATYYVPFIAHATMETMNCTAHVQSDRCDVWVPTQGQTPAHMVTSKISGLPPEKVHIHTTLIGCGLGRRGGTQDYTIDAVAASKATGKPVKVVWTREEDMKNGYLRSASCHRVQAGLDGQGRLTAWSHKLSCASILKFSNPAAIKNGIDIYCLWGIYDLPNNPQLSHTPYEFPNFYVEQVLSDLPIPSCPWRSVTNAQNAFVIESFIDEMAFAAGKDALEFRLQLLSKNMRVRRVLQTVAEKAGWGKPLPKGKGRGIAQHTCFGAHVAYVADVSVNEKDGTVKVDRIVAAVDIGPVINPNPVMAQVEGGIIEGVSTALKEEIYFANGGVRTGNFDDYKIIRMSEIPEIEIHLVKSTEKIGGIGEPGVPPTAPAIANAVFNATGARIRRIPMTPEIVLAALKMA